MPFKVPNPTDPGPGPSTAVMDPPPNTQHPAPAQPTGQLDPLADLLWPSLVRRVRAEAAAVATPPDIVQQVITVQGSHSWIPGGGAHLHAVFPLAVAVAAAGVPLYLVAGAGTGKSHLAEQIAQALGREFETDSFSVQTTEAKILGFVDAHGNPVITPLARAYEHGRIFIADEVDAGSAPSVAMNRALANSSATMAGRLLKRHPEFLCAATANTRGSGQANGFRREPIDAALLDRFFMLEVPQDLGLERKLCGLAPSPSYPSPSIAIDRGGVISPDDWYNVLSAARKAADKLKIGATFRTSSRPAQMGCKLAAAGIGKYHLCQGLLRRSLGEADWAKLADAISVEP